LEHEDGLSAPRQLLCARFFVRWCRRRGNLGKINVHRSPFSRFALDANVAAALPHDTITSGETEAAATSVLLGGKERFEEMRFHFITHSDSNVGDPDEDVLARGKLFGSARRFRFFAKIDNRCFEGELAATLHRIACVYGQIQ